METAINYLPSRGTGYETRQTSEKQLFVMVFASSRNHDPAHR